MNNIQMISIDLLHPHPNNPRKELGDLTELADSIRENGVFQNLTVVPAEDGYTVIIGHRRCAAAKLAGRTELPCAVVSMTEQEQLSTMLLENMQRSDLTPYEQAQGFQLMIDMGDTPEGIAQKTGFSKATVKRRLKMAELDQEALRAVSDRQISMADFDKLAQIESIEQRNRLLQHIGTGSFNMEVEKKIKRQAIDRNLPWLKAAIKKAHGNKMKWSDTYSGKFESISPSMKIDGLEERTFTIPVPEKGKLHYCLDEDRGDIKFYKEREKAAPHKKTQKELQEEKHRADVQKQCEEIAELSSKLRLDFVKSIRVNQKNMKQLLYGAVCAAMANATVYCDSRCEPICELMGEEYQYSDDYKRGLCDRVLDKLDDMTPFVIYNAFGKVGRYFSHYSYSYPCKISNIKLDFVYKWLCEMGYQMSADEKAMQDGTHPLLHMGKGKQ